MKVDFSQTCFNKYCDLVYKLTGITLEEKHKTMLAGRLSPRLVELGVASFDDYLEKLGSIGPERDVFVNLVTTNETYFHRTAGIWNYFYNDFLPTWYEQYPEETLNIWSAACSTGAEPYTAAIYCHMFQKTHKKFNFSIIGTDIAPHVIQAARKGMYNRRSVGKIRHVDCINFDNYFDPADEDTYQVSSVLKTNVKFYEHNLFKPLLSGGPFDFIFLRNVIIYFSQEDQELLVRTLKNKLKNNGLLCIGESETLRNYDVPFEFVSPFIYRVIK